MKLVKILCAAVLVLAVSSIAYAETQSVKVSGDITARGIARSNYDLQDGDVTTAAGTPTNADQQHSWDSFVQSAAEVQVEADLVDNVSGVVRLVNQRVWSSGRYNTVAASQSTGLTGQPFSDRFTSNGIMPTNGVGARTDGQFDVLADLAYIELREFLYSPLTVKIGRQDLFFGKGFIIGADLRDPEGALFAPEYTATDSFDAIRATLDYNPWTIDVVYSKIQENFMQADDDVNLYGVNVGYDFNQFNAEAEGYYWWKTYRVVPGPRQILPAIRLDRENQEITTTNDVHTAGLRGSFDPIEDWTVALEGALQWGEYIGVNWQNDERNRLAFALDAMLETRVLQDMYAWKPVISLEYIYYSGEENMGQVVDGSSTRFGHEGNDVYNGWDPMFRGKFDTAIREFQNVFYGTNMESSPSNTNQHQVLVKGGVEPTEDIKLDATYGLFWLASMWNEAENPQIPGVPLNEDLHVGSEADFKVTWDYTEDVSFNLLAAWFFPGDHFTSGDIASDVVGSVKLSF